MTSLERAPASCPMKTMAGVMEGALAEYEKPESRELARQVAIQAFEGIAHTPQGKRAKYPRIVEIVHFAKKMGYKKIGLAFCNELSAEAAIVANLLERQGFEVVSVRCKVGGVPKEHLGILPEQKINGPEAREIMCNPIAQARILNEREVDLAVMMGLCVGHDTLFFRHCQVPITVFAVKDRTNQHCPLSAINPVVIFSTEVDPEMR